MAISLDPRLPSMRRRSRGGSMVVAALVVVGLFIAALVGLIVAFDDMPAAAPPDWATTVLVLAGFVLFIGARRRVH